MKKLFSPNCVSLNLKVLKISLCVQFEEIIALDFESDERGMATMKFSLLKLKKLVLEWLPELKSICNVDAVVVCESLKWIGVRYCPKLKRMPFKLPQVRPFSPLKLRIYVKPKEWWESVEWDDLDAKSLLKLFVNFVICFPWHLPSFNLVFPPPFLLPKIINLFHGCFAFCSVIGKQKYQVSRYHF
ncbi:hypothetical protein PVK06_041399 [Gossypium arboreum]|uniref:Disease resistance protein At4g27190-like leucine-rich repeats domain-containing protein n=1 Tax=Gossypium arboreum TaxID=29729 RepID=A0ABR0N8F9_GOSAR|nr:hypothetical protein PVK06_041399 [Gossypium arboreum]